jgi:hypothetical protein
VDRGERPIKLGDSWFSPKSILVGPLEMSAREVEHWMGPGTDEVYHPQPNSECPRVLPGRQSQSDNVLWREGKNPDPLLRPRSDG